MTTEDTVNGGKVCPFSSLVLLT